MMRFKKLFFLLLVICTGVSISLQAIAGPASAKRIYDNAPFTAIDAYIEQQMGQLDIPGAFLAIVEGDKIVHLRGFGQTSPNSGTPTPQTPFFIGSLTKSITALAVMQLVETGKIDLDAPIQRYLPWFRTTSSQGKGAYPETSAQITVRHLLNQVSGLSTTSGEIPLADFDDSPDATERQARGLATQELTHPVGSAFEYSNSNYNLLGLIIEAVSGESYSDYVQKHVFTPLEMNHSYTSQIEAEQNGLASGYRYWFSFPVAAPGLPVPHGSLPSGQIVSSAEDMTHLILALLNQGRFGNAQILSSASIAEMQRGVAEDVEMGISMGKYGMGLFVSEIGQEKMSWHTGIVPNSFSYLALLPEKKKGVVLFLNAYNYLMTPALTEIGAGAAALLAGTQPETLPFVSLIPWMLRGQLLIPIFQMIDVVTALRSVRRWRQDPKNRPSNKRKWGLYILLPLCLNLLVALTLIPMLGAMRGFWLLFMPDFAWIALICGSFSLVWGIFRTGLVLKASKTPF